MTRRREKAFTRWLRFHGLPRFFHRVEDAVLDELEMCGALDDPRTAIPVKAKSKRLGDTGDTVGAGFGNCPYCGALINVSQVWPPRPAPGRELCSRCDGRGVRWAGDVLARCEDCRGRGVALREGA